MNSRYSVLSSTCCQRRPWLQPSNTNTWRAASGVGLALQTSADRASHYDSERLRNWAQDFCSMHSVYWQTRLQLLRAKLNSLCAPRRVLTSLSRRLSAFHILASLMIRSSYAVARCVVRKISLPTPESGVSGWSSGLAGRCGGGCVAGCRQHQKPSHRQQCQRLVKGSDAASNRGHRCAI